MSMQYGETECEGRECHEVDDVYAVYDVELSILSGQKTTPEEMEKLQHHGKHHEEEQAIEVEVVQASRIRISRTRRRALTPSRMQTQQNSMKKLPSKLQVMGSRKDSVTKKLQRSTRSQPKQQLIKRNHGAEAATPC